MPDALVNRASRAQLVGDGPSAEPLNHGALSTVQKLLGVRNEFTLDSEQRFFEPHFAPPSPKRRRRCHSEGSLGITTGGVLSSSSDSVHPKDDPNGMRAQKPVANWARSPWETGEPKVLIS